MEWIGWLSLAIVIGALIYLGVSAFKTFKSVKPKVDHLKEVQTHIQAEVDKIKSETDELKVHQQHIMADVNHAKQAATLTINEAKQVPQNTKFLTKTTLEAVKK